MKDHNHVYMKNKAVKDMDGKLAKVILERSMDGVPLANVERRVIVHSPDGFEWGYGGSGPTDLSLNILLEYTDEEAAKKLYKTFKNDVICNISHEGAVIPREFIEHWIFFNSGSKEDRDEFNRTVMWR